MKYYVINISPENWFACRRDTIFAVPESHDYKPRLQKGDLTIVRLVHTTPCGPIALWEFEDDLMIPPNKRQGPNEIIPFNDTTYKMKLMFRRLVEFSKPVHEGFGGGGIPSESLDIEAQALRGSIFPINNSLKSSYLKLILKQKLSELPDALAQRLQEYTKVNIPQITDEQFSKFLEKLHKSPNKPPAEAT